MIAEREGSPLNVFSLQGETALITGGGSGLGLGIASCFVQAGAEVVLVGRRQNVLENAVMQLGSSARCLVHDVTELERAGELIAKAGAVSILVNNAGLHLKKAAHETSPAEFGAVIQTHVAAAHSLSAAALPGMIARRHGSILFTASMTALIGMPLVVAYSAAKSAYVGMTRALAAEVSRNGVRVNAIAPGWIESEMLHRALDNDPERSAKILSRTPMARFGEPEDIGWAATYLCSPAARFVTGVVLPIDGGASIGF
jgi:NAD(P)-dependent dehydrogenase (short-subunit alcohol dehydrogenase family)